MDIIAKKTNKKLLAAFAVLAMVVCAFAIALPAGESDADGAATTPTTGDVTTVSTFEELKEANNNESVKEIVTSTSITITENFSTTKKITIVPEGNGGSISVSGEGVKASFGDLIGKGPVYYTVDCRNGASFQVNGLVYNVQLQSVEGANSLMNLWFREETKTVTLNVGIDDDKGTLYGTIGSEPALFTSGFTVPEGKELSISKDGGIYCNNSDVSVLGKLNIEGTYGGWISGSRTVVSGEVNGNITMIKGDCITLENGAVLKGKVSYVDGEKLSAADLNIKAGASGLTIAPGSIEISGTIDASAPVTITATGNVKIGDTTVTSTTTTGGLTVKVTDDGSSAVTVTGALTVEKDAKLIVDKGATLTVGKGATLVVGEGATLVNNGNATGIKYATGSKVVVDGNEYTVYHYTSGGIDIQYGISCGDVFYTGAVIDEYDVSVLSISLDDKFQMTNKTFTLVSEMEGNNGWTEIRDARTYADALKIQLTFVKDGESGTASNITVNLKTDLVVKPMPVDIRFSFPEKVGDITVSEFMKYDGTENVNDRHFQYFGSVGYYNLNGKEGYYFVIAAEVYDKKGNLMPNAQISAKGMESLGDGIYMLHLGKTPEEASQKMSELIEFTADCGPNYEAPFYNIDLRFDIVAPMLIGPLFRDDFLGTSTWTLYDQSLSTKVSTDVTKYTVTGKLKWKAGFTGFDGSNVDNQRGWYLGVEFRNVSSDNQGFDWTKCTADIEILNTKKDVRLTDGDFLFRIVDITKNPEITITDPNGFKTKYVLDISGIEFGSVAGYGETQAEAEDAMRDFGVDPAKLTENGSDVIDKTMFMIFNTSAYHGQKITATATNTTDGKNTSYSEDIPIGENQNICIWYFSFNHQFQEGKPGVYELEVKTGDKVIAKETESFKGVYVFDSGFYADATDAYNAIHKLREDIPQSDVAANTFYMIVGIYGYDRGTNFYASMARDGGENIITSANMISVSPDMEGHKWAFYFSFDNATQVAAPGIIYGKYVMSILENNKKPVAEEKIHVGASSSMTFTLVNTAYGKDLKISQDGTQVTISGKLYYQPLYKMQINWVDIPANVYPDATLIMKTPEGTVEDEFKITHTTAELLTFDPKQDRVYEFTIDFDGEGDVYTPTTYFVSFDGTFEGQTYGIYLSDPIYDSDLVQFKDKIKVGESFYLPYGPNGSKDFVGWKAENGKIYSGLSFVIVTEDMDGMDGVKDGKAVFTAVYKGSQQRDTFTLDGTKVSEDGKTLIINTSSLQTEGYRNLSAGFYYVVTMQNASGAVVMDKKIASPCIKNGGTTVEDVYSETFNVALTEKFGPGCIITVNFKTDFAMGQLQIVEPVVIVPEVVSPGGFEKDATDAFNAINDALKAAGRENGVPEDDVDSNTAYIVFETTEEMNGKELWGSLYVIDEKDGRLPRYYERMTFESAGAHVWYFSFNEDAPSHHPKNENEYPMAVNGPVPGKYVLEITLNERPYTLVAEYTFTID